MSYVHKYTPPYDIYNNVGAVDGYPGPSTGIAAAAGNPGYQIKSGGRRGSRKRRRGSSKRRGGSSKRRGGSSKRRRGSRKRMRGGSPALVSDGNQSSGYHQYMSNQPFTNSYSAGGSLEPSENALANPVLITPTNNCNSI